jgi:hypothetical protein
MYIRNRSIIMDLTQLTHKELVDLFLSSQGDVTLVPGDSRRVIDRKLVTRCFSELLRRSSLMMKDKSGGLHKVKR